MYNHVTNLLIFYNLDDILAQENLSNTLMIIKVHYFHQNMSVHKKTTQ